MNDEKAAREKPWVSFETTETYRENERRYREAKARATIANHPRGATTMTDDEKKQLKEDAQKALGSPYCVIAPQFVLSLLAENEALRRDFIEMRDCAVRAAAVRNKADARAEAAEAKLAKIAGLSRYECGCTILAPELDAILEEQS